MEFDTDTFNGLGRLLEDSEEQAPIWGPEELAEIWAHQLVTPVSLDLSGLGAETAEAMATLREPAGAAVRTFGELLTHPRPPLELLKLTKAFAKAGRSGPEAVLPEDIAATLYFAAIAAALVRCNERITRLDDAALREGFAWAADRPWLDEPTHELLAGGLARLEAGED